MFTKIKQTILRFRRLAKYKNSDYGTLIISSLIGMLIGIFVYLFHEVMLFSLSAVQFLVTDRKYMTKLGFVIFPLITMLGGLIIGIMRQTIFKNVTHEGMETVVKALVYSGGKIDWRNSFKSMLYSAISISTGGGAGREGPTVVLGAAIGSSVSQIFRLNANSVRIFCGAGAAAAISAIFNAPLGGIIFATEAIIGVISVRSFVALVVASITSTATTRILVGDEPLLIAPPHLATVPLNEYIYLGIAGVLSGFIAVYYLKTYNSTSDITVRLLRKVPAPLKPALGGLVVGALASLFPTMLEATYTPINSVIAGKGYALLDMSFLEFFIPFINKNYHYILFLLMAVASFLLKPISNAVTLASGSSGGTFAPAIKAGAMFGFAFGLLLQFIVPDANPGLYATVCAGAVLSGTFRAPLTGGIILFEISKNYDLILPLVLSSVLASLIVQRAKVKTFNALQKELVDDADKMHPMLKIFEKK